MLIGDSYCLSSLKTMSQTFNDLAWIETQFKVRKQMNWIGRWALLPTVQVRDDSDSNLSSWDWSGNRWLGRKMSLRWGYSRWQIECRVREKKEDTETQGLIPGTGEMRRAEETEMNQWAKEARSQCQEKMAEEHVDPLSFTQWSLLYLQVDLWGIHIKYSNKKKTAQNTYYWAYWHSFLLDKCTLACAGILFLFTV